MKQPAHPLSIEDRLRSGLMACMGRANIRSMAAVAERAGLNEKTVRTLHGGTRLRTLVRIAEALPFWDREGVEHACSPGDFFTSWWTGERRRP